MKSLLRAIIVIWVIVVIGGAGFLLGYNSGTASGGPLPSVSSLIVPSSATNGTPVPGSLRDRISLLWEAYDIVQREFYEKSTIDAEKLTYGAINGMLAALGDPHTGFSNPTDAKISNEDLKGSFEGIGVQVEMRNNLITVVAPLEGSPGEAAGIRAGDILVKIGDEDATRMNLNDAVNKIRGPIGTKVKLTLLREGSREPIVLEVARSQIKVVNVKTKMLEGGIGYLDLNTFTQNSGDEVKNALQELLRQNPKGIVFDLRNNPGGLLQASVEVASQFMKDGVVLYESRSDGSETPFPVRRGGLATENPPVIVLINGGSASASEIVAGALRDTGRAKIVGEKSYGKGSVQNVHRLSDGSSLRVTVAHWLTPKHGEIHKIGLTPDVVAPMTADDIKAGIDPQLNRAVDILLGR